jgi:hypothetical protein
MHVSHIFHIPAEATTEVCKPLVKVNVYRDRSTCDDFTQVQIMFGNEEFNFMFAGEEGEQRARNFCAAFREENYRVNYIG